MATKDDLKTWVLEALRFHGGTAKLVRVAEHIWQNHNKELERLGDLFFRWQYDMRWAAMELRKVGKLKPDGETPRGVWALEVN
ncbi:hypothetical protein ACKTEK_01045 [Tepidamorphus sp. 3E244]|uniref:hypothetical protein n=1 Tax=Tepidamorphus sp. 3E244 TaxID=3385498 RepID=UPI0038FC2B13